MKLYYFLSFLSAKETFHGEITGNTKRLDFNKHEKEPSFWHDLNRKSLDAALSKVQIEKKAKNVILFIGDGMGYPTQTAGRILIRGSDTFLLFRLKFPIRKKCTSYYVLSENKSSILQTLLIPTI